MDQLKSHLLTKGFKVSPKITQSFIRFKRTGAQSGYLIVKQVDVMAKTLLLAHFGDWKTGEKYYWQENKKLAPSEKLIVDEKLKEMQLQEYKDRQVMWEHTAAGCLLEWTKANAKPSVLAKDHEYSLKKRIDPKMLLSVDDKFNILIPCSDIEGKLWGIQKIWPNGTKRFTKGQKIKGCFYEFYGPEGRRISKVFFCEGFSTGASIYEALGKKHTVICGFNAGNLPSVIKIWADNAPPEVEFYFCGDEDAFTTRKIDGKLEPYNAGREAFEKTKKVVGKIIPAFPVFSGWNAPSLARDKPTDWNDLHCGVGLWAVKGQLDTYIRGNFDPAEIDAKSQPSSIAESQGNVSKDRANGVPDEGCEPKGEGCEGKSLENGAEMYPKEMLGVKFQDESEGTEGKGEYIPDEKFPSLHKYQAEAIKKGKEFMAGTIILEPGVGKAEHKKAKIDAAKIEPEIAAKEVVKKVKKPSEHTIIRKALVGFQGNLVKDEGELFEWTGAHWKIMEDESIDGLKRLFQAIANFTLKSSEIESCYRAFLLEVPNVPKGQSLFTVSPYHVNFKNGTIRIKRSVDGILSYDFGPHEKQEYLNHEIPHNFPTTPELRATKNEEFDKMIQNIVAGDPDKEGKIRALRQMFGACLVPLFPRFFLLHGPSGSGKSSLIITAMNLVHEDNWCSVEPHEFRGFDMSSMAGKLVNISTDIDVNKSMNDAGVKKVIDRMPMRIDRKFKTPIHAPLPAVHIFGANALPTSLDGASKAHERRWSFICLDKFDSKKLTNGDVKWDFANWVFEQGPEGIINFAVDGFEDLLASNGVFFNPESGTKELQEWQTASDPVGSFLQMVEEGEVTGLRMNPKTKVERKKVWLAFCEEWKQEGRPRSPIGKIKFYRDLEGRFFKVCKSDGVHYLWGFESMVEKSESF